MNKNPDENVNKKEKNKKDGERGKKRDHVKEKAKEVCNKKGRTRKILVELKKKN